MRSLLDNLNFSTVPAVSFPIPILNLFKISLGSAAFALQHHDAPHTQPVMHTWLASPVTGFTRDWPRQRPAYRRATSPVTGLAERLINPQISARSEERRV